MPEMKNNFQGGKMNKDLDERLVPNSEYRDALNVEIATSNDSDMGTLQTLKGNTFLGGAADRTTLGQLPNEGVCIGSIADDKNDKLYFMVAGNRRDSVIEFDYVTSAFVPICVDVHNGGNQRALNFNANFLITGINIIEDLLFWTDNNSEPKKINIPICKQGTAISGMGHTVLMIRDMSVGAQSNSYAPDIDENGINKLIEEKHLTVIRKGPSTAPVLEMIDTVQPDVDIDGEIGGDELIRTIEFIDDLLDSEGDFNSTNLEMQVSFDPDGDSVGVLSRPDFNPGDFISIYKTIDSSINIRAKVVAWKINNFMDFQVLSGNKEIAQLSAEDLTVELEQSDAIFQFKFPRFACRYKYEDGEYSAISPFTQPAFLPGRFKYLPKQGYNLGMVNRLRKLVVKDFVHERTIGEDVVSIDILYKDSNSTNIYSLKTIPRKGYDPLNWDEWNGISKSLTSGGIKDAASNKYGVDGWRGRTTGYLPITTEMISAVLPANQLLRPWDNVPRKALAQEVIGNRLIYGNYLQNYDFKIKNNSGETDVAMALDLWINSEKLGSIHPEEVHSGLAIAANYSPAKSLKSLRTYQVGTVYIDKYGRETPVFSNSDPANFAVSSFYVTKASADQKNQLNVRLNNPVPDWATHFKFFVKETSNEYYNLAMDRWYNAEDGNIWISFPSAERNKVDEETFLILKKEHDNNVAVVPESARYKVIAIENEAPMFIKTMDISMGGLKDVGLTQAEIDAGAVHPFGHVDGGFPLIDGTDIWVSAGDPALGTLGAFENAGWMDTLMKQDISQVYFRVKSLGGVSLWYRLKSVTYDSDLKVYVLLSGKQFGQDMGHTSPDGSHLNRFQSCSLEIIKRIPEDKPEFEGRFFVKILKDGTLIKRLHLDPLISDNLVESKCMQMQYIAPKEAIENANGFNWDGFGTEPYEISIDAINGDQYANPTDMVSSTGDGDKFWTKASKLTSNTSGTSGWFIDKVEAFRPFSPPKGTSDSKHGLTGQRYPGKFHRNAQQTFNTTLSKDDANPVFVHTTTDYNYTSYRNRSQNYSNMLKSMPVNTYQYLETDNYLGFNMHNHFPVSGGAENIGGKVGPSRGIDKSRGIMHISYSGLNSDYAQAPGKEILYESWEDMNGGFEGNIFHVEDEIFINKLITPGAVWRWKEDPDQVTYITRQAPLSFGSAYTGTHWGKDTNIDGDLDGAPGVLLFNYNCFSDYLIGNHSINGDHHHQYSARPWFEGTDTAGDTDYNVIIRKQDWASRNISSGARENTDTTWLGQYNSMNHKAAKLWIRESGTTRHTNTSSAGQWAKQGSHEWERTWGAGMYSYVVGAAASRHMNWGIHKHFPTGTHHFYKAHCRRRRFAIHFEALKRDAAGVPLAIASQGSKYLPTNDPMHPPHFSANGKVKLSDADILALGTPAPGIRPDGMHTGFNEPSGSYTINNGTTTEDFTTIPQYKTLDEDGRESPTPGSVTFCLLEQFTADPDNFSSINPAIFETEPKEDVGLDIYHEIGQIYPVDLNNETIEQFVGAVHTDPKYNSYVTDGSGGGAFNVGGSSDVRVIAAFDNFVMLGVKNSAGVVIRLDENTMTGPGAGGSVKFHRADGGTTLAWIGANTYQSSDVPVGTWYELKANPTSVNAGTTIVHNEPIALPWFNCYAFGNGVESDRIRDDYNQITIDNGPKASTTIEEPYLEERRKNGFIWSGLYNSRSGVNNLNQFIQAEKITKDVNPTYGSIQKLHARDSDLVAFCEDRVLKVFANKDALYNADGNTNVIATDRVLGAVKPFVGDYGISLNPESFASDSHRAYFSDTSRGAILRLSQDGITNISDAGMHDWFSDRFSVIGTSNVVGSFDDKKGEYNITLKSTDNYSSGPTLSFSEKSKGWVSFKSFDQENGISLNNSYYTFSGGNMYQHHTNETRNQFYGNQFDSSVDLLFNQGPGIIKSFSTLNYEGSQAKVTPEINNNPDYYDNFPKDGWYVKEMISNAQELGEMEFWDKEDKWFSQIKGVATEWLNDGTAGNIDPREFSYQGIGNAHEVLCPDCPSIITWECIAGTSSYSCEEISGPTGSFAEEIDCLNCANCNCNVPPVSFDCINGMCIDDGLGNGAYATHCDCVNSEGCCDEGAALTYTCQNITAPGALVYGCMDDGVTPDPFITQQRPSGWIGGATNYDPTANVPDCSCIYQTLSTWDCETTTVGGNYNDNCSNVIVTGVIGELIVGTQPQPTGAAPGQSTQPSPVIDYFAQPANHNKQFWDYKYEEITSFNSGVIFMGQDVLCDTYTTNANSISGFNTWGRLSNIIINMNIDSPGLNGTVLNPDILAGIYTFYSWFDMLAWVQAKLDPTAVTWQEINDALWAHCSNLAYPESDHYNIVISGGHCLCTGVAGSTSVDCIEVFDGTGEFNSYDDCEDECVVPSWDCVSPGVCEDPETGQGQYTSEGACLAGCPAPTLGCTDPLATNYNPLATIDDGSCVYPTGESWDCVNGNCADPGTGLGLYATLSICNAALVSTGVNSCAGSTDNGVGPHTSLSGRQSYDFLVASGNTTASFAGFYYSSGQSPNSSECVGDDGYSLFSSSGYTIYKKGVAQYTCQYNVGSCTPTVDHLVAWCNSNIGPGFLNTMTASQMLQHSWTIPGWEYMQGATHNISFQRTTCICRDCIITSTGDIGVCLKDNVMSEGSCASTAWPMSGSPVYPAQTSVTNPCLSQFAEKFEGTGVTSTTTISNVWYNPLNSIPGTPNFGVGSSSNPQSFADTTTYNGVISPNVSTVLFKRLFHTAIGLVYTVPPFAGLNAAAASSGYYTITETPDFFDVNKTLTASSGSTGSESHVIHCDTQDILVGMQVTGTNLVSCSFSQDPSVWCYPAIGFSYDDIRVVSVDHLAGTINLSEANVFISGDILKFSTYTLTSSAYATYSSEVICKEFTVSFTGSSDVDCALDHQIDFTQQVEVQAVSV